MEDFKKKNVSDVNEKEIIFSKSVKAGKRIYYLDVKKNRKDELFLAITESKKVVSGEGEASLISFEKHKIFLYKEDFEKFVCGLQETIAFINQNQVCELETEQLPVADEWQEPDMVFAGMVKGESLNGEIKIDIDFE